MCAVDLTALQERLRLHLRVNALHENALARYNFQLDKSTRTLAEGFSRSLASSVAFAALGRPATDALAQIQLENARAMQRFAEQIAVIVRHPWKDIGELVAAGNRRLGRLVPRAQALGRQGWTLPVRFGLSWLGDLGEEVFSADLDEAWVSYYVENDAAAFGELTDALEEARFFEPWRALLQEAVAAYRAGLYLVAVPALIACLDGAIAAATVGLDRASRPRNITAAQRAVTDPGVRLLCWASLEGLAEVLFEQREFHVDPPTSLNRAWVLHGRILPARPQADCLRLLQALETLSIAAPR